MNKVLKAHQKKFAGLNKARSKVFYCIGKDEDGVMYVAFFESSLRSVAQQEAELWCAKNGLMFDYIGTLN